MAARGGGARPAPSTTAERGGTAAVKQQQRQQQHQQYYRDLSESERAEYDRGADDAQETERREQTEARRAERAQRLAPARRVADQGAGVILAILAWGWVGMPFLQGGMTQVKATLRAKFLNQSPTGAWLP